jgi:hypothetical protein
MELSAQSLLNAQKIAAELSADSPKIIALSNEIANMILSGLHAKKKSGVGDDFWQYRELGQGETASRIDWRKTAKGDGIFIKEKEAQSPKRFQFWVDNSPKMLYSSQSDLPSKIETASALVIGLFRALYEIEERPEILGQNKNNVSPQQLLASLLRLGTTTPAPNKAGDVFIFSDGLNEIKYWQDILSKIKAKNGRIFLILINDPTEIEFDFKGRIIFKDEEEKIQIEDCGAIKNEYLSRIRNHFSQLSEIVTSLDGQIYFHKTDEVIVPFAKNLWQNIANFQFPNIRGGANA